LGGAATVSVVTDIDRETCLELLSRVTFGRVALSVHAMPRIVSVILAVHRGGITAHMQGAAEVGDGLDGSIVALQADGFDDASQEVWSVHVIGRVIARYESGFVIDPSVIEGERLA